MKRLTIFFVVFSIIGCKYSSPNDETKIVQLCLDKMHSNKNYDYLEQSNLILVKNEHTVKLGDLHFGKKQVVLIDVEPSDIKPYASEKDVVDNKRHIIIKSLIITKEKAAITIKLANVNQTITFDLIKKGTIWQVDTIHSWIS